MNRFLEKPMSFHRIKYNVTSFMIARRLKLNRSDFSICSKNQFIFVHIPKSAGKSIRLALFGRPHGACHAKAIAFKHVFGVTFNEYFKFSFVRNPWDRLYSAYSYLAKGGNNKQDLHFVSKHLKSLHSFEGFVLHWLNPDRIYSYIHFVPQHEFLHHKGVCQVDFIGRYENLENDFAMIAKTIMRPNVSLKHINRSTTGADAYKSSYTREMVDKVKTLYRTDVELFDYEWQQP